MTISVYTLEDLKDVKRLDGNVQFISSPDFPAFFFVVSGGSRFFFINLEKFIDFGTAKISGLVVEAVPAGEFNPPSTYLRVTNLYVDTDTEKLVIHYNDQPVS